MLGNCKNLGQISQVDHLQSKYNLPSLTRWPPLTFSSQYYPWVKCKDQENEGNNHSFKKLLDAKQIFLLSKFQLSVESTSRLGWLCLTSLCDWSTKLAPLSQPIRCKTKTNHDLVTCVFPRFRQFSWINFDFSLALKSILKSSDFPLWLLWFGFYVKFYVCFRDTQSKSTRNETTPT